MKLLNNNALWILLLSLTFSQSSAQFLWEEDGVPLRQDHHVQWNGWTARNTSGDIFVLWNESKDLSGKIYVQKYNPAGQSLWPEDVEMINVNTMAIELCPTPDGGLAALYAWYDQSLGPILKAQKVDAGGNILWDPDGVFMGQYLYEPGAGDNGQTSRGDGCYSYCDVVSDGSGGIFAVWFNFTHYDQIDMFAKHLFSDGSLAPGWNPHGNILYEDVEPGVFWQFTCSDDAGGFMVSWQEDYGIAVWGNFVQRVDAEGNFLWGPDGLQIAQHGTWPCLEKDGAGGLYAVWGAASNPDDTDLFIQRLDSQGTPLWGEYGLPLVEAPELQFHPQIVADGFGGAIVAWEDHRNSTFYGDTYCQRVNADGDRLWPLGGVNLSDGWEHYARIHPDGEGGLFATWINWETYSYSHKEAYIQRLTPEGALAWHLDGILLSGDENANVSAAAPISTGDGGALFFWFEAHDDLVGVYLQKTDENGVFQLPPGGEIVAEGMAGGVDDAELLSLLPENFICAWEDSRWDVGVGDRLYYQVFDSEAKTELTGFTPRKSIPRAIHSGIPWEAV
jgi:hypothetical protein